MINGKVAGIYKKVKAKDKSKLIYKINKCGLFESKTLHNLNRFPSGSPSSTNDYIFLSCIIPQNIDKILIEFFDGEDSFSTKVERIAQGHCYIRVKKSAFKVNGNPSWGNITCIKIQGDCEFRDLHMIEKNHEIIKINNEYQTFENISVLYNWNVADENGEWLATCEKYFIDKCIAPSNFAILFYINTTSGRRYEGLGHASPGMFDNVVNELINESVAIQGESALEFATLKIIDKEW